MSEQSVVKPDSGRLFVVATPIGHLEDLSRRAADVLSRVGTIAAEDTRRARTLLSALGLPPPTLVALHEHNEVRVVQRLLDTLREGGDVALISDAGTPLLSDPGFHLIRSCYEIGIPVHPVPGPSALTAALSVCPLPVIPWRFVGFLPAKARARRNRLKAWLADGEGLVFFEAPHRLRETLADLAALAADRRLFVARELTKRFEACLAATPAELIERMDAANAWRGEVVCVVEATEAQPTASALERQRVMRILAAELPAAQAARLGARLLGVRKSELYALAREEMSEGG